jgi:hypothetical protein
MIGGWLFAEFNEPFCRWGREPGTIDAKETTGELRHEVGMQHHSGWRAHLAGLRIS